MSGLPVIPFFDMNAGLAEVRAELDAAWRRVIDGGHLILGPELESFEAEFARACDSTHCVGVGNGLEALTLALRALGVGPGDEVIVAAHTFVATWLAVSATGATPVPAEPDPRTMNLDPTAVAAAVTPRTVGVIPVHLYGQPADLTSIRAIADRHGLFVLEDAAQAHRATWGAETVGSSSTATAFSFYPTKNLGGLGDGGAVVTRDEDLARRLRRLRNYGSERKYEHLVRSGNSRLDEVQAACLRARLRRLDEDNARRRRLAAAYTAALAGVPGVRPPYVAPEAQPVWHLYVLQVENRDSLAEWLAKDGVQTLIHYPTPCHLQPAYASLELTAGALPISEQLAKSVLSLPMWPQMPENFVGRVAEAVHAWARHASSSSQARTFDR